MHTYLYVICVCTQSLCFMENQYQKPKSKQANVEAAEIVPRLPFAHFFTITYTRIIFKFDGYQTRLNLKGEEIEISG